MTTWTQRDEPAPSGRIDRSADTGEEVRLGRLDATDLERYEPW